MLDQTQGFTHAGVERLNDSTCTYVWAILGAQDQERTPILGSGTAFTAQNRFLANISAAIEQAEETSISKYQSVLQFARGKLDFVIGEQLYMFPSDMTLRLLAAHISGYNNEILVATKDMSAGQNSDLDAEKLPPAPTVSTDGPFLDLALFLQNSHRLRSHGQRVEIRLQILLCSRRWSALATRIQKLF